jgi:hypothetical protein
MKKNIRTTLKSLSLLPLMLGATAFEAQSDTASIRANVTQIRINEGFGGNCLIRMTVNPRNLLPTCKNNWVSFSCDGTHTSKDVAYRMLEMSQMAFVLDKGVLVIVDDNPLKMHDGFCLATRLDLLP